MSYISVEELKAAFAQHLMIYNGYSPNEAAFAVSDFPDPYSNCYLYEDYVGTCVIDGEEYEQRASYTAFWQMGMNIPAFCFYTFYRQSDVPNHRVGEYMNAKKYYRIKDLDKNDFPVWNGEADEYIELEFQVILCPFHRDDGGEVVIAVKVTTDECELLKDCCREDEEIENYDGLEALHERVIDAVIEKYESTDEEDGIDFDDYSFIVEIPDEIVNEVNGEDE